MIPILRRYQYSVSIKANIFRLILSFNHEYLHLVFCFLATSNGYIPYLSPIRFRNIVIFGDSTSDTGNVFELIDHTYPIPPDYWKGRYSNGPNWVDQLEVQQPTII